MSTRSVGRALGALLALGTGFAASPSFALDHLTVQLPFYPQGPESYLFLAEQKGWFRAAGIDVEILDGRGSNYSVQVVSSGHADVGAGELVPMIFARQRGADVKAVAEWFPGGGPGVVVPRDSSIKSPADLKGKRVGIVAAGPWPPILPTFLQHFGLNESDLSLVYVDSASLFSMYATKQTDALLTTDLASAEANSVRPSHLFNAYDYGVRMPGDGLFVRSSELSANQGKLLARFVAVCARAIAYVYNGHETEAAAAIRALRPQTKIDAELLQRQIVMFKKYRTTPATKGKPPGWQSPADWQERISYMVRAGLFKDQPQATDFYSNALVPDSQN